MEAPRAVTEAGAVGKAVAVMEGARRPWVLQQAEDAGRVLRFLWLSGAGS